VTDAMVAERWFDSIVNAADITYAIHLLTFLNALYPTPKRSPLIFWLVINTKALSIITFH